MGSNAAPQGAPGQAVVPVSPAPADRIHAVTHRAVLAARDMDDYWDSPIETALAAADLARHTHVHMVDAERALTRVRRWWLEGHARRTSDDVAALALAARAAAELQRYDPSLLEAAVAGVVDLVSRDPSVVPDLHLALSAWALDPLVTSREAEPWPAVLAQVERRKGVGVNESLRLYTVALSRRKFSAPHLVQELVTYITPSAGSIDSCILIWLITVAGEKLCMYLPKEDSALQVLFRRRADLVEKLGGEVDDQTFHPPETLDLSFGEADVVGRDSLYLSSFEAMLLDFSLASKEQSQPWVTFEEAESLFSERAVKAQLDLESAQVRFRTIAASLVLSLGVAVGAAFWFILHYIHIFSSVASPASVSLTSLFATIAIRIAFNTAHAFLFESLGVFFGTLTLLAAAVAVDQALSKPYISDVGGLSVGAVVATGAVVFWAIVQRLIKARSSRNKDLGFPGRVSTERQPKL